MMAVFDHVDDDALLLLDNDDVLFVFGELVDDEAMDANVFDVEWVCVEVDIEWVGIDVNVFEVERVGVWEIDIGWVGFGERVGIDVGVGVSLLSILFIHCWMVI